MEVARGWGALAGRSPSDGALHRLAITDQAQVVRTVDAKHVLVATGGVPTVPDIPGAEHVKVSCLRVRRGGVACVSVVGAERVIGTPRVAFG